MNKTLHLLLPIIFLFTALPVQAAIVLSEKILQKGVFSPPQCEGAAECLCEADIKYPVISGMINPDKQGAINNAIKKSAEQLKCQGEPAKATGNGDNFSVRHGYEVTFESPEIIGFKFTDWAYEGGAHGNGAVEGMIIDLGAGKVLSPEMLFSAQNIPAVNQVIYDSLAPKSDGIFSDEIEKRKDSFIKDDKCQGCTIILSRDGLQVVFQAYEVAPFAEGNPAIMIPNQYISYPAIEKALSVKK